MRIAVSAPHFLHAADLYLTAALQPAASVSVSTENRRF
jgi:hypothetical protein